MSLSKKDIDLVKGFWEVIRPQSELLGAEAVGRMLMVYPQTKAYFSHWSSTAPGSAPVKNHGREVMGAIGDAVHRIDDMVGAMGSLSYLHAFKLRVDPSNFKYLAHCVMVCISMFFPEEFTPEVHLSVDKFFQCFARALSERYR
ncbi:hypothetical protein COCON_G00205380 [Conger conger]|uniref:Globin domain-containing protein n=1 Tax=Conger conger TaxID=82655 RepID=A0A9Q1HQ84_CONCO|nr:hemoglobin anodic subunit alpha-like [Conger conger]KAJ8253926.1 hypothetical protein COCON_G00205380 [Conger conger]